MTPEPEVEPEVEPETEPQTGPQAEQQAEAAQSDEVGSAADRIEYEVDGWSGQSRSLLDSLLTSEGVTHVWQGARLMVGADDEAGVDRLIDIVIATATKGLDRDRAQVLYEVGTWSSAMQTSLAETLEVAEIPFEWDENGDLKVYEDDESRVDEILDDMPDPDDPEVVDPEGLDVQEVLSLLWTSLGTLAKRPTDADAVLGTIDSAGRLDRMGLPFGFESSVWRDIAGKAARLRAAFESDDADVRLSDDEVREASAELHRQLRHYI